jgi:O-antigen/teichoic acid export membrane protein
MLTSSLRRLGKHSLIYALGPIAQRALGFLLLPLVTAYIGGRDNYGVTEMAAVTIAIAGQLFGINLLYGMTRYYADYDDPRERGELVTTTLVILLVTNTLALVLALAFRAPLATFLFGSPTYADALVAVAAILLFQTIGQVGLRYLQILERSAAYGVLTTLKLVLEIGLKVWFLVALGLAYMGVFYSVLGGEVLIAVALTGAIVWKLGLRFSKPMARRLAKYSLPLVLSGVCMFVLHQADRFFVLHMRGAGEVGLYGLGYKLGAIVSGVLVEAFGLIWFPFVFARKDDDELCLLCRRVLTYFTAAMCAGSLALAVFSGEIVRAMDDSEFHDACAAIPIVALAYVFWAIYQVVHTAFYVREKTGQVSLLVAGAAVLNCLLNVALVPALGYMGAAWATLATFAALALWAWWRAEQVLPVRYEIARVLAPIALGVLLFAASRLAPVERPVAVIGVKAALVLAFPVILWSSGYLKGSEKDKIKDLTREARAAVLRRIGGSQS